MEIVAAVQIVWQKKGCLIVSKVDEIVQICAAKLLKKVGCMFPRLTWRVHGLVALGIPAVDPSFNCPLLLTSCV